MNRGKIRILGIAPYEGLKSIMQKIADERNDIDLTVFVGDLQEGAELAQKNFHKDFDIIISRGGTAELIGTMTNLPVIEISLSVYDILRAIKMGESFTSHYAIVGFPGITDSARLLCDLLQNQVEICTIHNASEVETILLDLKTRGYRTILCDMIANTTAKRLGMNAILITSGSESIGATFDQAVRLCHSHASLREENRFLQTIIQKDNHETLIFRENGSIFFTSLDPDGNDPITQLLQKETPISEDEHRFFKNIDGMLYSIVGRSLPFYDKSYTVFYIFPNKVPLATSKYGIRYQNQRDVENSFYNSFYNLTGSSSSLQSSIEQITPSDLPVMIIGEEGTGKERVADAIYTQSPLRNNALITIDFSMMNEKSWNFLINHYNSPFNDNGNTLHLKNIQILPEERRRQLLSIIIDMNLARRNRLIFSAISAQDGSLPSIYTDFINQLSCLTMFLPPLRERKEEIPALANLCLNSLNVNLAKEILGLEQGAMQLLCDYDWPSNYTQFKRLLNEMTLLTTTPYILETTVYELLRHEPQYSISTESASLPQSYLNLNRTLEDINRDIVQAVLANSGGNKSVAAKRLGISRTTLWRFLKE